jgi:hypothetical protein
MYNGALGDLNLTTDPWTMNRYAFGGGNPISMVEIDGHYGIGEFFEDVAGVGKGIYEGASDTVTGLWDLGGNAVSCVGDLAQCGNDLAELGSYAWNNPGDFFSGMWGSIWDPIAEDWNNGNPGESIGRGIFAIAEVVFGTKGLTKIAKLAKLGDRCAQG